MRHIQIFRSLRRSKGMLHDAVAQPPFQSFALPAERIISGKEEHVPQGRGADPEIICFFK